MWILRDQIRAYQFLRRRLVSALVWAEANRLVSPSKRLVLGEDGALHPVLNFASARLLAGSGGTKTVTVPVKALHGVPRGEAAGLIGAPDSLLGNDRLLAGSWTRCIRHSPDRPAGDKSISTVLLGHGPGGQELSEGQVILAGLRSGELFLLTGGMRHRLVDDAAVVALDYASADSIIVALRWLNTIPSGRDLRTVDVAGSGAAGPGIGRVTPVREGGYSIRRPAAVPLIATATVCAIGERITIGTGSLLRGDAEPHLMPGSVGAAAKVYVPGGSGAVVAEEPACGVKTFGFCRVARPGVPAPVLALLPTGPTLVSVQAQRTAGR